MIRNAFLLRIGATLERSEARRLEPNSDPALPGSCESTLRSGQRLFDPLQIVLPRLLKGNLLR